MIKLVSNDIQYSFEEMDFNKRELNKKLVKIATPIAIQGMVVATLSMVDNLMVGFLGETELAAVGIASQIFTIHYLVLFGLLSGSATFMAQFYGTRDHANIRKVTGFAFTLLSAWGVLCFVLSNCFTDGILSIFTGDQAVRAIAATYVRINSLSFFLLPFTAPMEMAFKTTQQVRLPMVVSIVVFSSNTLINYVLIFGKFGLPALGVAGAAIGTVTARALEVIIDAYFAFRKKNVFCGSVRSYFGWNPELIRRVIKNATPTTINELLWSLGQSMFVAAFNRIGTTAYAAYQAANVIFNIFNFAAFSIGDAALILIGEKLGEGDKDYTWKLSTYIINVTIIVSLTIGVAAALISWPLSGLFKLSVTGRTYAFYILIIFGATMFIDMFNGIMITGILRAGGDTRFAMYVECGSIWLIAVPLAFLAALVWHLPIYLALLVTRGECVIRASILLRRYLSRKWMNTVIEDL